MDEWKPILTVIINFHHRRPDGIEPFDFKMNDLTTRLRIHVLLISYLISVTFKLNFMQTFK